MKVAPSGERHYNFFQHVVSFACLKSFGFLNFWRFDNFFLHVCVPNTVTNTNSFY